MTKIALLCAEPRTRVDAIHAATRCLDSALDELGLASKVVARRVDGMWSSGASHWPTLPDVAEDFDVLLLQYNPFLYGRRGFAPWLVRDLVRVRARRRRPKLVLYVHETAMPLDGVRKTLMGLWQRGQLRAARATTDLVLATIEEWASELGEMFPHRRTVQVPVGSTLPDMRHAREATRASLGAQDRLVVATLSSGHESHMVGHVAAAATRIAESCPGMLLLTLGAGARLVDVAGIETYAPGEIPAAELAALIGASDLFLAPLIDGVSARRTSAMAALQHGVAVVATCGPLTDAILERSGALVLCHADDEQAFAHAAAAVARDPARRKALARTGGALYARTFAWPPVARRLVEALELE